MSSGPWRRPSAVSSMTGLRNDRVPGAIILTIALSVDFAFTFELGLHTL
jgi:hypothetical protein